MLNFVFPPQIQAGIASGAYEVVRQSATGQLIGLARDTATGQFVGHAVGMVSNGIPLNPITVPMQFAQMYQTHRGFTATLNGINAIQSSLGVLQATTAVIGVGVAATAALSAVNLWQTLKLREDVKQLKLDVQDGFIDLKQALRDQGTDIIEHIDEVARDITFGQHRLELIKAYGRFLEASKLMKTALSIQDSIARTTELANARQTLSEALAIYNNPHLLSETCAAGQLRRFECAWAIEQTLALSYQLQGELAAASDRISHLRDTLQQNCLTVANNCETEEELEFLFPELTRIHHHDLAVLEVWQNQMDWARSLSPSEQQLLASADFNDAEKFENGNNAASLAKPPELTLYEELQPKSHPASLSDQLKFLFSSSLRRQYETYISEQSAAVGYKALVPANLEKASNLAVANLYWYFKVKEESEQEETVAV